MFDKSDVVNNYRIEITEHGTYSITREYEIEAENMEAAKSIAEDLISAEDINGWVNPNPTYEYEIQTDEDDEILCEWS